MLIITVIYGSLTFDHNIKKYENINLRIQQTIWMSVTDNFKTTYKAKLLGTNTGEILCNVTTLFLWANCVKWVYLRM